MNKYVENVYVINMDKDKERLNNITEQCKKLKINFEKISGIDINQLSVKEKNNNIDKIFQLYGTDGAIGCSLSHKKIYKDIIDKGYKNALILEDDVYFTNDFYEVLNNIFLEIPNDYDIIYLGCGGLCSTKRYNDINLILKIFTIFNKKKKINKKHIFIPEFPLTAHGYIISRNGCKKILKNYKKINVPIDGHLSLNINNYNIYASKKKIIYQDMNITSNNSSNFPIIINKYLNNIYDNNNISYKFILNLPMFKLCNNNISILLLLLSLISFIIGLTKKYYLLLIFILYLIIDFDKIGFIFILVSFLIGFYIKKLNNLYINLNK